MSKITVDIVGDASKFKSAAQDAEKAGGKFSSQAVKGFGLGVGLAVFDLAKDAVGAFVGKLGEAKQAYQDDQESQALMAQTLRNVIPDWDGNTAAIETYAAAQAARGFQDDEVRASIAQLAGITHDATEATELNTLAEDLARAKGIDLAAATDIVTKAAQGNGKALKGLGIDTQGATDAASLLDAVQKNVTGSADEWAKTAKGKTAVEQVKQAEAWEKIGKVVSQVAEVVLPIAADAFVFIADVISNVSEAIGPLVSDIVKNLSPAFKSIMAFITGTVIPIVSKVASVIFPAMGTAIDIVGKAFGGLQKVAEKVWGVISGVFRGGVNMVVGIVNAIIRGINSIQVHIGRIGVDVPGVGFVGVGPFNWNGLGIHQLPYLHEGGIVPGPKGSDQLAILQAGEKVTPAKDVGSGVTVNVMGNVYGISGVQELTELIRREMALGR